MDHTTNTQKPNEFQKNKNYTENRKRYLITWYEVPTYIEWRSKAFEKGFDQCPYDNCALSTNKADIPKSDAVIFKGRHLPTVYRYSRPNGQIWIFAEDESPLTYHYGGGAYSNLYWRSAFNWTMTYDKTVADIYLPYGEIWKRNTTDHRDFVNIGRSKTKGAIIITSHCNTLSKRETYINRLQKYIDVDILGSCGRKWNCGKQWIHDNCFDILNSTYKFYLAFENALCRNYVTEKVFENFNYDTIIISRADKPHAINDIILPADAYINTYKYSSIEKLGKYLNYLISNDTAYARLLQQKSQYYFPGYEHVYQRALCNICERMNNQGKYKKVIADLRQWKDAGTPCRGPMDL